MISAINRLVCGEWYDRWDVISTHYGCYIYEAHTAMPQTILISALWYSDIFKSFVMMTSSNGNIFRITGHLCGEFTGPRWIPHTKASDAELWCFLWSVPEQKVSKQSGDWWSEPSSSLQSQCNGVFFSISNRHPNVFVLRKKYMSIKIEKKPILFHRIVPADGLGSKIFSGTVMTKFGSQGNYYLLKW